MDTMDAGDTGALDVIGVTVGVLITDGDITNG